MNTPQFRKLINLFESRISDVEYQDESDKVVAVLKSYNSQIYTKLAQKVQRIEQLESELTQLKDEVKQSTREDVAFLFDAEDAVKTRVIQTVSFIFQLSKDPKATESPKYKDILTELSNHMTPELIAMMETLKKQMVTVTQKAPSLRITSRDSEPTQVNEGKFSEFFNKFLNYVRQWGKSYDSKLDSLKAEAASI